MQSLVFTRLAPQPESEIQDRSVPVVKDGFTLVKMHAATVNQLSNQIRSGKVGQATAPLVLSNDGSGTVIEGGRFQPGTRVLIYGGGQLGITEDGLQQQIVLVPDKAVFELPDALSLDEGAALPINYVTAYQALKRVGKVSPGKSVLISGASGALGRALIQTALAIGAIPIAVVSTTSKVAHAKRSGASEVIDLSCDDLTVAVENLTDGMGADYAMDTVGGNVLGQLLRAVRTRGTVVSIGFAAGTQASIDVVDTVVYEKRLLGYDAHLETDSDVAANIVHIQRWAAEGQLRPVIDSVYPLADHEAAYAHLESRHSCGAILLKLQPE